MHRVPDPLLPPPITTSTHRTHRLEDERTRGGCASGLVWQHYATTGDRRVNSGQGARGHTLTLSLAASDRSLCLGVYSGPYSRRSPVSHADQRESSDSPHVAETTASRYRPAVALHMTAFDGILIGAGFAAASTSIIEVFRAKRARDHRSFEARLNAYVAFVDASGTHVRAQHDRIAAHLSLRLAHAAIDQGALALLTADSSREAAAHRAALLPVVGRMDPAAKAARDAAQDYLGRPAFGGDAPEAFKAATAAAERLNESTAKVIEAGPGLNVAIASVELLGPHAVVTVVHKFVTNLGQTTDDDLQTLTPLQQGRAAFVEAARADLRV